MSASVVAPESRVEALMKLIAPLSGKARTSTRRA